ncbi:MAG TPA: tripartite tricarboxylate transporter TctB family protein [Dehalococcoidales bacterium]
MIAVVALVAVFCFAIASSRSWAMGPRLYAWSASILGLGLTSIFLIRQIQAAQKKGDITTTEGGMIVKRKVGTEIQFFVWIVAFAAAIWLFGFEFSVFLFILSYVRLHHGSWLLSAGTGISMALIIWGIFTKLLNFTWISGLVPRWMGF